MSITLQEIHDRLFVLEKRSNASTTTEVLSDRIDDKSELDHTHVNKMAIAFSIYDAEPARSSETNIHGGLLSLVLSEPLTSASPFDVVKGIGKIMIAVKEGTDLDGEILVTGTSVDRDTGETTASDTETIIIDGLTIDGSSTDTNGNTKHAFTNAYITSKWYVGTVAISTPNLTLTDVDAYHVSFEQFDGKKNITLDTFDVNLFTTNVAADFDAYLYGLHVDGSKCLVELHAELHVGADGETAIANKYWRLRKGKIDASLDGSKDGVWVDVHYSNSPAYVEDMSLKVWATETEIE